MLRNNIWNHVFHHKKVNDTQIRALNVRHLIRNADSFLAKIGEVSCDERSKSATISGAKTLLELLEIHKEAWNEGFQNRNLGPCSHGMFRCDDISKMTANEVYLGDVYGLFTLPISEWETTKDDGKTAGGYEIYDYLTVYEIVLRQYKNHLSSNINSIVTALADEDLELRNSGY